MRTFSGFPPAIHPPESPAAAGSAAIIRQAQELSRFAALTLRQIGAPRNTKKLFRCEETVEDISSLWKSEENQELISRGAHKGIHILECLFDTFVKNTALLPLDFQELLKDGSAKKERILADFVAGMTDSCAREYFERLFQRPRGLVL